MEPVKTHGAALPQQELTCSAGGCPSGPRPGDLMQEGHEGANLHVGRRVANEDTPHPPGLSSLLLGDVIRKRVTRLEVYKAMVTAAKLYNTRSRPMDLDISERISVILNLLYPEGIPSSIDVNNKSLKDHINQFTHKCDKLYLDCRRNMSWFCKKNHTWLAAPFQIKCMDSKELGSDHALNETSALSQKIVKFTSTPSIDSKELERDHELNQTSALSQEIDIITSTPCTSTDNQKLGTYYGHFDHNKRKVLKNIENTLEGQPNSKIIKILSHIVTDEEGAKLCKNSIQDFEFVMKECLKSPTRPKKIATIIKNNTKTEPLSPDEALSMIIDRKLTAEDYKIMQQNLKSRGFPAYPPYYKVQSVKKHCYPDEDITITEKEAFLSLHSLLLHTFRRIVESHEKKITTYCEQQKEETVSCILEGSWGFDGSTGQSLYKQKFTDGIDDEHCLFATTYIPLVLKTQHGLVLWSNPNPQSFRYCRPLKIQYRPENKDLILKEKERVEEEIKNLSPLYAETGSGRSIIADPKVYLTIIDGKVYNVITGTTSQLRCACCGATAAEFNKLDVVRKRSINSNALLHGLSPLHCWIRFLEFLLHLGYKNDPAVRKWRVTKNSDAARIVEERKKLIQTEIRSKMSLLVDIVRPNSGTTNDGNTARAAFSDKNRKTFADILGIDEWLVDDLHTILVALSSALPIDVDKFREFCNTVAVKYVEKYNWYYMSVTMHKILVHGWQIIETSPLPIGMLSEQAGESRNKFWRYDREHHTRKMDRKTTILDLFRRALESSDPFISDMSLKSRANKQNRLPIPAKVLSLLKPATEPMTTPDPEIEELSDLTLCTEEILLQSNE